MSDKVLLCRFPNNDDLCFEHPGADICVVGLSALRATVDEQARVLTRVVAILDRYAATKDEWSYSELYSVLKKALSPATEAKEDVT